MFLSISLCLSAFTYHTFNKRAKPILGTFWHTSADNLAQICIKVCIFLSTLTFSCNFASRYKRVIIIHSFN